MSIWKYTKKIIALTECVACMQKHEDKKFTNHYIDWYYDQVDLGLADGNINFWALNKKISEYEYHTLVTDQKQADSFLELVQTIAKQVNCDIKYLVVDNIE